MLMKHNAAFAAIVGACLLAGCNSTSKTWSNRYGPDPDFDERAIKKSVDGQNAYMNEFIRAASPFPTNNKNKSGWYYVALAGYNYVDEACDNYLIALFKIDRRRYLVSKGVTLAGTATTTILGAYAANPADIAAVSAAFGFGSSFADAVGEKYIFSDKPELIYGTAQKLRVRARQTTMDKPELIDSKPAAYGAIRSYLTLCLPPVIDAYITKVIAESEAKPKEDDAANGQKKVQTIVPELTGK